MGIHYVRLDQFDLAVELLEPEALMYAPQGDGRRLVGVEYLALALADTEGGPAPWFDHDPPPAWVTEPPTLMGQVFDGPMPGHEPGMPWHYDLHVWLWQGNPNGTFAEWNPNVHCP